MAIGLRSSNPVLGDRGFNRARQATFTEPAAPAAGYGTATPPWAPTAPSRAMTIDDVVVRTAATLGVLVIAGALSWSLVDTRGAAGGAIAIGAIAGFILAMVISFKASTNPALILTYAACEGVALGALSKVFDFAYPGIVVQAVIGTAGVFAGMLVVYKTGAIRVTPRFTRWVVGALIGFVILAFVNIIASLFTPGGLGLRDGGPMAILFSLVGIGIAAMMFLLDFDMVDRAIRSNTPEKFAWYAAFGLTVTLVWLYLEILRLLSYLRE